MANTPVSATVPTVVYTPSPAGTPHAFLYNQGGATVYLGGSGVSTATGLALRPNNGIDLPYAGGTIWAVSAYSQVLPVGTVVTATTTFPAGTTLTVPSGGTAFTAGMWIAIETGSPRQELAQVNGSNAGSVFTNTPMQFAHGTTVTFWQATALPSLVQSSGIGAT